MKIDYSAEKNLLLKKTRGVDFEDAISAIEQWDILDILRNENYPHQSNLILKIHGYVYICPCVGKIWESIFLKTLYPSRKQNKIYIS